MNKLTEPKDQDEMEKTMHPNNIFKEAECRVSRCLGNIYSVELKHMLRDTHPQNFLRTEIALAVVRLSISFRTIKGNYKNNCEKFMIMDRSIDEDGNMFDFAEMQAELYCQEYNALHPLNPMLDHEVEETEIICEAVLMIG